MVDRLTWRMVRFTALRGGPAYTDLGEVAAILDTKEPHAAHDADAPQLPVARGATIYLKSGAAFYVRETAETVFEEVHRYRTELEPAAPALYKYGASAPSERPGGEPPAESSAPGEQPGRQLHDG